MNKKTSICLIAILAVFTFTPDAYSLYIDGWWKARMMIQEGDFVTGSWFTNNSSDKKVSYIYISNAMENTLSGVAYLILYNPGTKGYIIEPANPTEAWYFIYNKNDICVIFIPSGLDLSANPPQAAGSTIVLRVYGTPDYATALKGFYTLYDIENVGTPEMFVRMGPVHATRVDVQDVPQEVMDLIPH